ncbi:MAG: long-chain fatty acid--CoA ligase [Halobacteriaceae archaeon]
MSWRDAERAFESPVFDDTTLPRMFEDSAARHADRPAQAYKGGVYPRTLTPAVVPPAPEGTFRTLSYGEMRALVRNLAAGFRELGVEADDRVAIFAHTRMEWAVTDFAALAAGGVVVTIYPTSTQSSVRHLLRDSDASVVVVAGEDELDAVLAVEDAVDLDAVVAMDAVDDRGRADVHTLAAVHDRGQSAFDRAAYESWLHDRSLDDLASLIYTSGTTGMPKGVELTHRNFRANVNQCYRRFGPRPDRDGPAIDADARAVSFLPLAHVFERLTGHFLLFAAGAQVAYAESPDTLREDFAAVGPTTGTSVPRVYEKIYDSIRAEADSPLRRRIFEWAADVARTRGTTEDPGAWLSLKHRVADALVFRRVREALGGEVDFLISGGGSLSPSLCALYHGMGLPVLEGYGLTETSPVVAANPIDAPRIGTIGPPVVDCETRLDESIVGPDQRAAHDGDVGELLVRGPNVFDGYHNLPGETNRAFTDVDGERWFHTGDVVARDPDGYLTFVERAKQLLTLSTGKNVAPGPIEDAFVDSELVSQAMVVGDGRKFVGALLVPDVTAVRAWAAREDVAVPDDDWALCRVDRVRARIGVEVDRVNEAFEPHERIKQFRLVPVAFTEENDLLTPTMKKKRRTIHERFADEIEALYAA